MPSCLALSFITKVLTYICYLVQTWDGPQLERAVEGESLYIESLASILTLNKLELNALISSLGVVPLMT